uniref:6-phosphogluconate dehydrogenase, decarboxylating n=1 Tax=Syphacia muris TaxID=451379 RepID=A0A0N5AQ44_9BILA
MVQEGIADIAVVGLAVMGQNLILNMNDKGFVVCAFNRTVSKVDDFLANEAKGTKIVGAHSFEEMAKMLKRPRRVLFLVKAGSAVDSMISKTLPFLEKGDIVIDAGNSEYTDTNRRYEELKEKGIFFVGCGVSGGEEGARHGPSMMPGGAPEAWPYLKDIFQKCSAKVESNGVLEPCCDWVGKAGAGHFVKMIHNGIEYGDMQLITEAYDLLLHGADLSHDEMADVFDKWNKEELDSYLIQITSEILRYKTDNEPIVPKIMDMAGQKGTGKWTAIAALTYGSPLTLIGEAVFARYLSSLKKDRVEAEKIYPQIQVDRSKIIPDKKAFIEDVKMALYASKIVSYAQGFVLLAEASKRFGWDLNFGAIALMWRGGCIIRSRFLGDIKRAFDKNPNLTSLLFDDFFKDAICKSRKSWSRVISVAAALEIPAPAFSSAFSFFAGYKRGILPAGLIQALRDYFGAHTYELLSDPGTFHHTNWTGEGGRVTSSTYQA